MVIKDFSQADLSSVKLSSEKKLLIESGLSIISFIGKRIRPSVFVSDCIYSPFTERAGCSFEASFEFHETSALFALKGWAHQPVAACAFGNSVRILVVFNFWRVRIYNVPRPGCSKFLFIFLPCAHSYSAGSVVPVPV